MALSTTYCHECVYRPMALSEDRFLQLHLVYGVNVRLARSGTQATRVESFANGVCFSTQRESPSGGGGRLLESGTVSRQGREHVTQRSADTALLYREISALSGSTPHESRG